MKGKTNASASGGYENVNVHITSDEEQSGLIGAVVTITYYNGFTESKVWNGSNLLFKVPANTTYTITYSEVENYIPPVSYTSTAIAGNSVTITGDYLYRPFYDLSIHDIYGNVIEQTTANCYIVKEADKYGFPLVYGNALKNGTTNSAAYTKNSGSYSHDFVAHDGTVITTPYIEDLVGEAASVQLSIADTDGVFTNLSIIDGSPCRYVQFEVASVPATGANGVISVKNSSGTIMWNWHIWVWNEDMTTVEVTNSTSVKYKLLPYNLASKWDSSSKTYIKNWHYQFGRPNPILCPSAYNSTTNHASYGVLSYTSASIASNLQTGIQNPTTFYKYSSGYNIWFSTNSSKTYNLWDANCTATGVSDNDVVKTIYDPSPVGFKMPNGKAFTGFSVISNANGIVKFTRYSGDTTGVKFPLSGERHYREATLNNTGSKGSNWLSSTYSSSYASYLYFETGTVKPNNYNIRASGYSVRPVEE